jgi:chromate reductase, NAD(P)H dehydrogenase (quinone)
MRIEIISGSPRERSLTRRIALHLKQRLEEITDHIVGLIDIRDWNLPPVQSVFTSVENTPEEFQSLARRIFTANAFILVSPEYNGSYSPAMKNLIDHFPKQYHKAFAVATGSPGALGGIRAAQQMQSLVDALFGIGSPYMLVVANTEKKFDDKGNLVDKTFDSSVHNFVTEFLWLAENLVDNKIAREKAVCRRPGEKEVSASISQ